MKYVLQEGKRYGFLVITSEWVMKNRTKHYRCICDCGECTYQSLSNLEREVVKSCGCKTYEMISEAKTTHGHSRNKNPSRLYRIYRDMKHRCYRELDISYPWYGAKGIRVCDEWNQSFESFLAWATQNGYRDDLTLDRLDSDEDYCPENCRWSSTRTQVLNRRLKKRNKAGHVGVYYEDGRWRARIWIDHGSVSLGRFTTFEEAVKARQEGEKRYHDPYK